jgi:hypothetical protein
MGWEIKRASTYLRPARERSVSFASHSPDMSRREGTRADGGPLIDEVTAWAKTVLSMQLVDSGDNVCELFCNRGAEVRALQGEGVRVCGYDTTARGLQTSPLASWRHVERPIWLRVSGFTRRARSCCLSRDPCALQTHRMPFAPPDSTQPPPHPTHPRAGEALAKAAPGRLRGHGPVREQPGR